jgi:hypothetical protein
MYNSCNNRLWCGGATKVLSKIFQAVLAGKCGLRMGAGENVLKGFFLLLVWDRVEIDGNIKSFGD